MTITPTSFEDLIAQLKTVTPESTLTVTVSENASPSATCVVLKSAPYVTAVYKLLNLTEIALSNVKVETPAADGSTQTPDSKGTSPPTAKITGNSDVLGHIAASVLLTFAETLQNELTFQITVEDVNLDWTLIPDYPLTLKNANIDLTPAVPYYPKGFEPPPTPETPLINLNYHGDAEFKSPESQEPLTFKDVTLSVPCGPGDYHLKANLDAAPLSMSPEVLFHLFGGDLLKDQFNNMFNVSKVFTDLKVGLEHFRLKYFEILFDPQVNNFTCRRIRFGIEYEELDSPAKKYLPKTWTLLTLPGNKTIEAGNLYFTFTLYHPVPVGELQAVQALAKCDFKLARLPLTAEVLLDFDVKTKYLSVALYTSSHDIDLSIKDAFDHFGVSVPTGIPEDIKISSFNLSVFPLNHQVDIGATLQNVAFIEDKVKLEELSFDLSLYKDQEDTWSTHGDVKAVLKLGSNTDLSLSGDYTTGRGMSLSSELSGLELDNVLQGLAGKFGFNVADVPEFIRDIDFEVLKTTLSTRSTRMEVNFEVRGNTEGSTFAAGFNYLHDTSNNTPATFKISGSLGDLPLNKLINTLFKDLDIDLSGLPEIGLTSIAFGVDITGNTKTYTVQANCKFGNTEETLKLNAQKDANSKKWSFVGHLDFSANFPLDLGARIPVASDALRDKIKLNAFRLFFTSRELAPSTNGNEHIGNLPTGAIPGVFLQSSVIIGQETFPIYLQVYRYPPQSMTLLATVITREIDPPSPHSTVSSISWINVQKSLGPVTLEKIGVGYKNKAIDIYPNITVTKGGVDLSLDGLYLSMPLKSISDKSFAPKFELDGLGIGYENPPITMEGSFLKSSSNGTTNYFGEVSVQCESFGLMALGGYAPANGSNPEAMFLYTNIEGDFGGPPAACITNLAFGFGVNYNLITPSLEDLSTYPLLPPNAPSTSSTPDEIMTQVMPKLEGQVIRYDPGENWLAAGFAVTSFDMVSTFVLASVSFGNETKVSLLGSSSLTLPKGAEDPIGYVSLNVSANFDPNDGLVPITGVVNPSSYLCSSAITLRGGFALYTWYSGANSGDFVFTIGGYNAQFNTPQAYPKVPRVSVDFSCGPFHATGQAYLALTPGSFMAGFDYRASWSFANISAWYTQGFDIIVEWAPFSYQADGYVSVGCSVDLWLTTVHASAGASAHVWGPDFGGTVHVDLDVVSFTISFGSDHITPTPVSWNIFAQKFLQTSGGASTQIRLLATGQDNNPVVAASIRKGLIKTNVASNGHAYNWLVDPEHFEIVTTTKIPATEAVLTSSTTQGYTIPNNPKASTTTLPYVNLANIGSPYSENQIWNTQLNLKPMEMGNINSIHTITLTKADISGNFTEYVTDLDLTPILTNSPQALWGDPNTVNDPNAQLLKSTLVGFQLSPAHRQPARVNDVKLISLLFAPGNISEVSYSSLQVDPTYTVTSTINSDHSLAIGVDKGGPQNVVDQDYILRSLADDWINEQRNKLLANLSQEFNTKDPNEVSLSVMSTETALEDWPVVGKLGDWGEKITPQH